MPRTALLAAALLLPAPLLAQVYTRVNANGVVEATNAPDSASFRLTYPGKGTLIHSRSFRPSRYSGQFDAHVEEACRLHQVSPDLVRAVIAVESEFDQWAVSSKGARGLMQLMPATMRRFGVADAFDARANILAGTRYLRLLLDQFAGDAELALAAYNAGENAVARYGGVPPFKETRGYVAKIQALLGGFTFAPTAAAGGAASFFTPSPGLRPPQPVVRPAGRTGRLEPARPRTYYRWRDPGGVAHVAEAPPPEGTVYQTVRALD
ncbi:MAG TPA: lytic transglycosylase domain-containing protein [Vicinamibacteria bacterium]|nr:lytic transglycosylase domain-containing protein [Vicinamibacteria bacterium]